MKYLIILNLLKPYIDAVSFERRKGYSEEKAELYAKLIKFRYSDFRKVFIFFSESQNRKKPDLSNIWSGALIYGEDLVLSSGITFDESHKEKPHASYGKYVLNQLPWPAGEIVVTGLHFSDYVDKFAEFVHGLGIEVRVDEDLTELFFMRDLKSAKEIPLGVRASICATQELLRGNDTVYFVRQLRKKKPWFVQL